MKLRGNTYVRALGLTLATTWCVAAWAGSADVLTEARALSAEKHRAEAIGLLSAHLAESPRDVDARLLLGLILSWDGQYERARTELTEVLRTHPNYTDASLALIHVEFWDDHPEKALAAARAARRGDPTNADLVLAEAKALTELRQEKEAQRVLREFLQLQPNNSKAKEVREQLSESPQNWKSTYDENFAWFSDHRSPWQEEQLALSRATDFGTAILRLDHADQYGEGSNQIEFESYPHIRSGTYAYVEAAFSPDGDLYARHRAAGEVFQSLPDAFEVSLGYRYLRFSGNVNMFTGSVSKYRGQWLLNTRFFLIPGTAGDSRSIQISARRYFGDGASYFVVRGGYGATPGELQNIDQVGVLHSRSFACEYDRSAGKRWLISLMSGISDQDRVETSGLKQYVLDATIYYRF